MYMPFDTSIIKEKQKQLWGRDETPLFILILIAIYLFITQIIPTYLIVPVNILGASMEPTLHENDRVILFKQGEISYGDIIVLYAKDITNDFGGMGEDIIKRVMGVPGDTVWFEKITQGNKTNFVFHRKHTVNGMVVETVLKDEYYVLHDAQGNVIYGDSGKYPLNEYALADDEYFVLGDNRGNSWDSRSVEVGKVKRSDIKGRALFIIRDGVPMLFDKVEY